MVAGYASRARTIQNELKLNNRYTPEDEIAFLRAQLEEKAATIVALEAQVWALLLSDLVMEVCIHCPCQTPLSLRGRSCGPQGSLCSRVTNRHMWPKERCAQVNIASHVHETQCLLCTLHAACAWLLPACDQPDTTLPTLPGRAAGVSNAHAALAVHHTRQRAFASGAHDAAPGLALHAPAAGVSACGHAAGTAQGARWLRRPSWSSVLTVLVSYTG